MTASPEDRNALVSHDQSFFDALVAADSSRLDTLLADDFLLVAVHDGSVVGKADLLQVLESGAVQFPAIQAFPDEAVVRRFGDVGIVVGRTGMNFTDADGSTSSGGSRYTHVFVADSAGRWRLVSAQGTTIPS